MSSDEIIRFEDKYVLHWFCFSAAVFFWVFGIANEEGWEWMDGWIWFGHGWGMGMEMG